MSIDQSEPLTVCQVLQNLPFYAGRLLQIRGKWNGSNLEGECNVPLQLEDHRWPSKILLTHPSRLSKSEGDEPVNWELSSSLDDFFIESLRKLKTPIFATIMGRLDVGSHLTTNSKGQFLVLWGYGHLNYFPARMIIKEISNIVGSGRRKEGEEIILGPVLDD